MTTLKIRAVIIYILRFCKFCFRYIYNLNPQREQGADFYEVYIIELLPCPCENLCEKNFPKSTKIWKNKI